ncbi:hypothetical protein [Clostridium chrysemydis]|uniref:hypothetical protein n=1 Tax=Clostridium chrysemydis TaxID=2665504 RepID=UPI001883A6F2|nr:hypothetical protein [Clostridium chrysemydis]
MGKIVTKNNKVKFEIKNKEDCILYLGHLLEYFEKKKVIYWNLLLESLDYLYYELKKNNVNIDEGEGALKSIIKNRDLNIEVDFYKFKLFNSAINLIKNEMINVIGDFSKNKIAISYNNYLDIISKKNIIGVKYEEDNNRKQLVDEFNTYRNYTHHFTSDKLCEWIGYREKQIKENKNCRFEFGKEFNIYMSDKIQYKVFVKELEKNILFYEDAKKITDFMKKDFEILIGEDVNINIKKTIFDYSAVDITYNGFASHNLSKNKHNKL